MILGLVRVLVTAIIDCLLVFMKYEEDHGVKDADGIPLNSDYEVAGFLLASLRDYRRLVLDKRTVDLQIYADKYAEEND